MFYAIISEYRQSMTDELPPPPLPGLSSSQSPMSDINDVGVICSVCHRRNDGMSDFCTCRESLIGYRTLNTKQVASWVTGQLRERETAGVPTRTEEVEALREWAGRGDGGGRPDISVAQGCLMFFLWVAGLLFTFVGVWSYAAIDSGGGSESAIVLAATVPLGLLGIVWLAAAIGLTIIWFWVKRSGN
jgi:hypothetical protein